MDLGGSLSESGQGSSKHEGENITISKINSISSINDQKSSKSEENKGFIEDIGNIRSRSRDTATVFNYYNDKDNTLEGEESKNNDYNSQIYKRDSIKFLSSNSVSSEENQLSSNRHDLTLNIIENNSSLKCSKRFDYIQDSDRNEEGKINRITNEIEQNESNIEEEKKEPLSYDIELGSIRSRNQRFQSRNNTEIIDNLPLEYIGSDFAQSYEDSSLSEIFYHRNHTISRPSYSLSLQKSNYLFCSELKMNNCEI